MMNDRKENGCMRGKKDEYKGSNGWSQKKVKEERILRTLGRWVVELWT